MPINFEAIVDPDDMTEYVRAVPAHDTLTFLNEFPTIESEDNQIDWGEITRTNRTAQYRAWDGRIHVSRRDASKHSRVDLPPLSTSLSKGELESLQLEFARNGGTNQSRLATAAYNDAEQLTREVQNRLELAWGDVLADGILTLPELGGMQADYGVPANQKVIIATANKKWTTANASTMTPLSDLQAWNDVWTAANGRSAGRVKTSLATRRAVLQSKEVIDAVHGSTAGRTRVTLTELEELLRGEGLPTFDEPYDTSLVDDDDQEVRVLASNRVLLLPEDLSELGGTAMGVTATALELLNSNRSELSFEEAAGIVGVVIKEGPPFREYTYVDAVGMPVLTDSRKLLTAQV